jgi:hypothetical protein
MCAPLKHALDVQELQALANACSRPNVSALLRAQVNTRGAASCASVACRLLSLTPCFLSSPSWRRRCRVAVAAPFARTHFSFCFIFLFSWLLCRRLLKLRRRKQRNQHLRLRSHPLPSHGLTSQSTAHNSIHRPLVSTKPSTGTLSRQATTPPRRWHAHARLAAFRSELFLNIKPLFSSFTSIRSPSTLRCRL